MVMFLSTLVIGPTLSYAEPEIASPLKQIKQGIHVLDVKCGNSMVLILKKDSAMPACVDKSNVYTLVTRGWAIMTSALTADQEILNKSNANFSTAVPASDYHLLFFISSSSPQYEDNLHVFAKHLKRGDYLLVGGNESSSYEIEQKVQKIKSMVNQGVNVDAIRIYNKIDDLVNKVPKLPRGFDYIGYDYEEGSGFSPEFTTNATRSAIYFDQARHAVSQYDMITGSNATLIIMPPFGQLGKSQWNWGLAAKHADIMSIQFQAFMKDHDFLNYVLDTISQVKQDSMSTKVMVELSLVPKRGTPQDNLNAIYLLSPLPIDAFFVFYHPPQTSDLEQFFDMISRK